MKYELMYIYFYIIHYTLYSKSHYLNSPSHKTHYITFTTQQHSPPQKYIYLTSILMQLT